MSGASTSSTTPVRTIPASQSQVMRLHAHVVHTLLEARGQARLFDPETPQLHGDGDVLGVGRRALCLVHGDLDLEVLPHRRL
jgi:hypothetical protein